MDIINTDFDGLVIIQPKVFNDSRGSFLEIYHQKKFQDIVENIQFVQDNLSFSRKNVIRGLHLQEPPYAQAKLVTVVNGMVKDVVVDVRRNSPTYGKYFSIILSGENHTMLYIPIGFAHGFVSLAENTVFLYKCSNLYSPSSEVSILWNDPDINIDWEINNPIVSDKDNKGIFLKNYSSPF